MNEYYVLSDPRSKRNISLFNSTRNSSLTMDNIEVIQYNQVNSDTIIYGFSGPSVEANYPNAVVHQSMFIDNIDQYFSYQYVSDINCYRIKLFSTDPSIYNIVSVGKQIEFRYDRNSYSLYGEISEVYPMIYFIIDLDNRNPCEHPETIYIRGTYESNVIEINPHYLYVLNFDTTKQLIQRLNAQQEVIDSLNQRVLALENPV